MRDVAHLGNLPRFIDWSGFSWAGREYRLAKLIRENRDLFRELGDLLERDSSVNGRKLACFHHSEVSSQNSGNLRIQETAK
ncbi:protein of unknown function (plasmid) [Cupriavidus taiwanensis]|uniref:Uncharacterized protein n=1 Tax=Cupriavidus taiwanensis TaxID=164546 RepID=A0A375HE84_9BURK|nr:protein of unknown function [Cupriavidus taiwanensis]SPD48703.1 protein of unknown function [Cupriavidus taiwanensis]